MVCVYWFCVHALLVSHMAKEGMEIEKAFGEVVRELRREQDLTQEKLAELSELHANFISLLERGERKPTINTVFKLAQSLGLKPYELIRKVEGLREERS